MEYKHAKWCPNHTCLSLECLITSMLPCCMQDLTPTQPLGGVWLGRQRSPKPPPLGGTLFCQDPHYRVSMVPLPGRHSSHRWLLAATSLPTPLEPGSSLLFSPPDSPGFSDKQLERVKQGWRWHDQSIGLEGGDGWEMSLPGKAPHQGSEEQRLNSFIYSLTHSSTWLMPARTKQGYLYLLGG